MSEETTPGRRAARELSDHDHASADGDQTAADLDQGLADSDQSASERDQHAAERDQQSADRDRAESAQAHASDRGLDPVTLARSEHDRALSASERLRSADARMEATNLRDENAARRDRIADDRDEAARARDQLAASIDAEIELLEREHIAGNGNENGGPTPARTELLRRLTAERRRAVTNRARAADQRDAAARDRLLAAEDRDRAHHDRRVAAQALERESIDHLTGALGRRAGRAAIQREMARATRFGETLVLMFVDVDGLKATNDDRGHLAGDSVLRATARCLTEGLRAYDVVMRFGGDEFVCTLSDQDTEGARTRFAHIATRLAEVAEGQTITVGFAEQRPQDTIDTLIGRADGAMLDVREVRRRANGDEEGQ
ncbi:MAG: GGDEF domain-containing protein [Thermoleophilaceae bacterium]